VFSELNGVYVWHRCLKHLSWWIDELAASRCPTCSLQRSLLAAILSSYAAYHDSAPSGSVHKQNCQHECKHAAHHCMKPIFNSGAQQP
ncbi:hypothetical protein Dimus_004900, partial [Dionaea muscipula]